MILGPCFFQFCSLIEIWVQRMDLTNLIYRSQCLSLLDPESQSSKQTGATLKEQLHMRSLAKMPVGEAGREFSLPGSLITISNKTWCHILHPPPHWLDKPDLCPEYKLSWTLKKVRILWNKAVHMFMQLKDVSSAQRGFKVNWGCKVNRMT